MVTLSLEFPPATRAEIHHAYRKAAKACHPDRFAGDASKTREAEERFKAVHAAYQALTEHCIETVDEDRGEEGRQDQQWQETFTGQPPQGNAESVESPAAHAKPAYSPIWFGNAAGCYAAPNFPPQAQAAIARHLGAADYPVAIVDLSGDGSFHSFFLLATQGIFLRDVVGTISLLSYADLGRVELIDRKQQGKLAFWELIEDRLVGLSNRLSLDIFRRSGSQFCSLDGHASDSAKTTLYHFLSSKQKQGTPGGF